MKNTLFVLIIFLPFFSFSQQLHLNLFGGFANYQGDLQGKQFTLDQSNGAVGAGLQYDLNSHFSLRSGLMYGRVEANDKLNKPDLQMRNLSFQTKILEGNILLDYNFFDLSEHRFTPYVFAGLGVYHFNPYSYDTLGNKIFLKPLSTEGEGLAQYPSRKPYKLTQFNIPFGAGLKLRVTENVSVGYEAGLRKLFTDYLDDVSTTYVDPSLLAAAKGPKAVEMAYRGNQVKNGDPNYPIPGSLRGGAKQKDWYYFQGITISIGLNTGSRAGFGGGSKTGCPVRVL